MDGIVTFQDIEDTLDDLDLALRESRSRGLEWVRAEAHYYTVKARAVDRMEKAGKSASLISMVVKGDPEVNEAMMARDESSVLYENAREARNVYKKRLDTLREEFDREWSRAGMTV